MNEQGLVSIITPSYNCEQYVSETIKSVQAQTYASWELIFQDDCSTDNTRKIVEEFAAKDYRIKYGVNPSTCGAAVTRNNALRRATGRWIAFLDSDDLWEPEKLEKQIAFMSDNNYHFSYTCYSEVDENSNELGTLVSGPNRITKFGMYTFCWPGCLTVMYDKDCVGLVQIKDIKKNNDYAMWLQISKKTDCYLLNKCLAKYRKDRIGSISSHSYLTLLKWHYKLFRDAEDMNTVSALCLTMLNVLGGLYKKLVFVKR